MIDAVAETPGRQSKATPMETGPMAPNPEEPPIRAPNGVQVAHPKDLIRAKPEACLSRNAARDYVDMAYCADAWPDLARGAASAHIRQSGRTCQMASATLEGPPPLQHQKSLSPHSAGPPEPRGMGKPPENGTSRGAGKKMETVIPKGPEPVSGITTRKGAPIPETDDPIAPTPALERITGCIWRQTPTHASGS